MSKANIKYIETVGKRKTSVARVRISEAAKNHILINNRETHDYFPTEELRLVINDPFEKAKPAKRYSVSVKVVGGGIHSQAEAVRHGISRALLVSESELKPVLRKEKLLTRDSRIKERRKFGLKKARKAPQWSKR